MSKVSLVISDVDGTLLTRDKVLTAKAQAAVKALHAKGIAFAITSGRPPKGMAMLIEPLALKTPIGGFNGAIFVDPDMLILEKHVLAVEGAELAVGIILEGGLDAWVYTGTDWLIRNPEAPHVEHEQWVVKFAPKIVGDFGPGLKQAVKITGISDDHDAVARCEAELRQKLGARASVVRSQPYYIDVTHADANKGVVVDTLSRILSMSPIVRISSGGLWRRTHVFWGDERFVPKSDVRSNYRTAAEALLSHVPIPAANVHPIPTEGMTPADAAFAYQRTLKSYYGAVELDPARPLFDVTLLGLGEDGHTASLFPRSQALAERERWVVAVTDAGPEPRISLTYPLLESSRHVLFLVAGEAKRAILRRVLRGDQDLPAARLRPTGSLLFLADEAAAGGMSAGRT